MKSDFETIFPSESFFVIITELEIDDKRHRVFKIYAKRKYLEALKDATKEFFYKRYSNFIREITIKVGDGCNYKLLAK